MLMRQEIYFISFYTISNKKPSYYFISIRLSNKNNILYIYISKNKYLDSRNIDLNVIFHELAFSFREEIFR